MLCAVELLDREAVCIAGTGKVTRVKKGTWLDQTKVRQELGRKPLSAHQQRQMAHTAAGRSWSRPLLNRKRFNSSNWAAPARNESFMLATATGQDDRKKWHGFW